MKRATNLLGTWLEEKWKRAADDAFPDSIKANIVMTGDKSEDKILNLIPKCQAATCGAEMRFVGKKYDAYKDQLEIRWTCPSCAAETLTSFYPGDLQASSIFTKEIERIEGQEKLRRVIEEKRKAEAQGEEVAKRLTAARYRRDGLPKELQEQLATGKIPPMPGDELPVAEWMRLRGGASPTATEEAMQKQKAIQQQADALRGAMVAQKVASKFPYLGMITSFAQAISGTYEPKPPAPAVPDKTTEQAQEELTGVGRRKIIVSDGENNP